MSCQGGAMTKANTTHATGSNCEQDWRAIHERLIQLSKDAAHIDWDWVASPRAARLRHAPRPLPAPAASRCARARGRRGSPCGDASVASSIALWLYFLSANPSGPHPPGYCMPLRSDAAGRREDHTARQACGARAQRRAQLRRSHVGAEGPNSRWRPDPCGITLAATQVRASRVRDGEILLRGCADCTG